MAEHGFTAQTLGDAPRGRAHGVESRVMWVGDQKLMVAIKRDASTRPPLLLFNGIGANWELAGPFLEALTDTTAIIFDLPGVGGSPLSVLPYRPSSIARGLLGRRHGTTARPSISGAVQAAGARRHIAGRDHGARYAKRGAEARDAAPLL
jgi:hypothetical protein